MALISIPFSAANFLANGEAFTLPLLAVETTAVLAVAAGAAGVASGVAAAGAVATGAGAPRGDRR